jgi:hypothetical protein
MSVSTSEPELLILPAGAIPMELTRGHKNPEAERALYSPSKDSEMVGNLTDTIILLRKQLKRVTLERDAYKLYVPQELLTFGNLVRHTSSPELTQADAGQITNDS